MSMCLYVYVFICLYVFVCVYIQYMSIRPCVYASICRCVCVSTCLCVKSLCVYMSMYQCVYESKVYVCCLTWSFNCRLLIKENPWHIRHFTCWLEHIKTKRKPLLLIQNYDLLASHNKWQLVTITTAPISLNLYCLYV